MRKILSVLSVLFLCFSALAEPDTLRLSSNYTTHILFETDLSYVDISDTRLVAAMIVEKNKNVLAIKARAPFNTTTSITALESNREIHSFIVLYDSNPKELVLDLSKKADPEPATIPAKVRMTEYSGSTSMTDIYQAKRVLYHICTENNGIEITCDNIVTYGDVLYMVLSLENKTLTDYKIEGASFSIESRKKADRSVMGSKALFPRNRYGALSANAGQKGREVYSFDKMTLDKGQVLRVYFYEADDQRNLVLEVDGRDINRAQKH